MVRSIDIPKYIHQVSVVTCMLSAFKLSNSPAKNDTNRTGNFTLRSLSLKQINVYACFINAIKKEGYGIHINHELEVKE